MQTPRTDAPSTRFDMTLESLDDQAAAFGTHLMGATIPRVEWERMGKPSFIQITVQPMQPWPL